MEKAALLLGLGTAGVCLLVGLFFVKTRREGSYTHSTPLLPIRVPFQKWGLVGKVLIVVATTAIIFSIISLFR